MPKFINLQKFCHFGNFSLPTFKILALTYTPSTQKACYNIVGNPAFIIGWITKIVYNYGPMIGHSENI